MIRSRWNWSCVLLTRSLTRGHCDSPCCRRILKVRTCAVKFAVRVECAKVAVWKDFSKWCNLSHHCRYLTWSDYADRNRGAEERDCVEITIENVAARIYVKVNQKFWSGVDSDEERSIFAMGEQRTTRKA